MTTSKASQSAQSLQLNTALIQKVPLFAQLNEEQAGQIAACVTRQRFKKGQPIIEKGHRSDALFIVFSGRVCVSIDEELNRLKSAPAPAVATTDAKGKKPRTPSMPGEPREVIVAVLQQGDHFGEMSIIDGRPHSATVRAEVVTDVLVLKRTDFMRCLAENLAISYSVMKSLTQRLRQADAKIQSLALMDVYGRVARALLELAVLDAESGEWRISERLSRQHVAKIVGASREMVSRVMKDLGDRGFITEHDDGTAILRPNLFMAR